ncbi:UNVERIFIED_CONTAM: putative glycosyl hydrolase [Acetivibrio alkalicellulosi]
MANIKEFICPPSAFPYIIKPGDTFYSICLKFNITLPSLFLVNSHMNLGLLEAGYTIFIPTQNSFSESLLTPTGLKHKPNKTTYSIKPDDSLHTIALKYGISVRRILKSNPTLNPEDFLSGQIIYLPHPHISNRPSLNFI